MAVIEILSAIISAILGSIIGYEYKRRRDTTQQKRNQNKEWFNESLDIIGRGMYTIERAFLPSDPDYDYILDELGEFSERLYVKSNNPPEEIPEAAVATVSTVAQMYTKASAVAEANTEKEGTDLLSELFEMAQKEQLGEYDFEEALEGATDKSEGLSEVMSSLNQSGFETDEIAEAVENIIEEWDEDEFAQFVSLTQQSEGDSEEYTDFVMNMFFNIAMEVSKDAYLVLQDKKNMLC